MTETTFTTPPESFLTASSAAGIHFEPEDIPRIGRYLELLYDANSRMNLTGIRDPEEAWFRHVLDSLTLLPWVLEMREKIGENTRLIDVGSGGGLPGMILACVQPDLDITLLETTGKKARFLAETAEELGLERVQVANDRAETMGRDPVQRESYHLVTARAVGPLNVLAEYAVPLAHPDGLVLAIKGAKAEAEIEEAKQALHKLHASVIAVHQTSTGRIVVIEKNRPVPRLYPREVGEPKRRPLN
ncbi:MAG: 16S rRNA (guanine(527)-N(7))-methyltransferase RsmG [Planctomycetota bacterium]|jgi:16S rRNA (guanine527-N7)-methyltransferase|nr:16S rRNA (guanine(527)-N(7))-methyltransferase RsmG [Planctomycetota bacterium]